MTLASDCIHLGGMIPAEGGPFHLCGLFGKCSTEGGDGLAKCSTDCQFYRSKLVRGNCLWRAEHLREDSAELCGMQGQTVPICRCSLHGECAIRRYCHHQKARSCLTCSDHEECLEILPTRPRIDELPPQVYSSTPPRRNEPLTRVPISKTDSLTRHLIYHIWPRSGDSSWQWNVAQLLKRIELFDGCRTVGIVTSPDADSVEQVQHAFTAHRVDHWIVRPNDPAKGESATFRAMLRSLPIDGVTFYAHAKGVKHGPITPAIRSWVEMMYRVNLDEWPKARSALESFPVVGALKQHFHVAHLSNCHNWHFAGTFFWMRNRDVFQRPEWRQLVGGYYSVELWPGRLFRANEAFCLFGEDLGDLYDATTWNQMKTCA